MFKLVKNFLVQIPSRGIKRLDMKSKKLECKMHNQHPDHGKQKGRLMRVQGQVGGIMKMIDDRRYCPEILIQIRAASKALQSIESEILGAHLRACVKNAVNSKNQKEVSKKIEEMMVLFKR
jgi:DNA-binding FrmR family transcriptional regulator